MIAANVYGKKCAIYTEFKERSTGVQELQEFRSYWR
jgi:hypothetical protein